jgi:DNA-binding winged helix-turn-helix (wHTH) protein/TolB-like protein
MTRPRVRFGPFDFDAASGDLRRDGAPVRLQPQPAAVLAMLVAHAGDIVTRDELRRAIWGPETFVDFDRGLNFCVAQIRAALGDSAEAPRFIRTLPKRGYQFIAPIDRDDDAPSPSAAVAAGLPPDDPRPSPVARFPPTRARATAAIVLVALLAVALAAAGVWMQKRSARAAAAQRRLIAVALFDADSGAPESERFAQGLTDAVIAELTMTGDGRYGVIGNAPVLRTARTVRDLNAIDAALHVRYVVLGSVERDGGRMRVLAHLIRLPEQTHLGVARLDRSVADPFAAQSEIARAIVASFSPRLAADAGPPIPSTNKAGG